MIGTVALFQVRKVVVCLASIVTRLGENILSSQDRVIRVLNFFKSAEKLESRMLSITTLRLSYAVSHVAADYR